MVSAAAAAGVRTIPRIALSAAAALTMVGVGVVWGLDPTVPEFWVFGPKLPFAGWSTGVSIIVSAAVALALLGWSVVRFRTEAPRPARHKATAGLQRSD
jgi:membrane protein implicated in regulation of membrane protease activity